MSALALFFKFIPHFWAMSLKAKALYDEGRTLSEIRKTLFQIEKAHEEKDAKKSSKMLDDMWSGDDK